MNSKQDKLKLFFENISKFFYLNILFILFTLAGLIVFGIGPSIKASYYLVNKWHDDEELEIFETFKKIYLKNFFRSNFIFLTLHFSMSAFIIATYFTYVKVNDGFLKYLMLFINLFFVVLFYTSILFSFYFDTKFNISIQKVFKYSLTLPWGRFKYLFLILAINILMIIFLPMLFLIFFGMLTYFINYYANIMFENLDKEKIENS